MKEVEYEWRVLVKNGLSVERETGEDVYEDSRCLDLQQLPLKEEEEMDTVPNV